MHSNPEIYKLEKSFDNFFNDTNSFIVKLGLSDSLMTKIINTYYPINNKICFINSKINNCQYYTNIYNKFIVIRFIDKDTIYGWIRISCHDTITIKDCVIKIKK